MQGNIAPLEQDEILQAIYRCLGEINAERSSQNPVPLDLETRLLGSSAELDSLELVNLVVRLESLLAERLGRPIVLVDQDAFSETSDPFRNVQTLVRYVVKKASAA